MLSEEKFRTVIASTPLVSIDLIVINSSGQVLLGKRENRPAIDFWFVPGGRVMKDEPFDRAYSRLLLNELCLSEKPAKFRGIYQHFYDENFYEDYFSTHYIVLAYEIEFECDIELLPKSQHSKFKWFDVDELLDDKNVHEYTKWYFQENMQADNRTISL